jgi:DNA-directed RNA polymerase subunit H (RpoH/RPB5)
MENISLEYILIQSRITILDLLHDRGYETTPFRKMIGPELMKMVNTSEALRMKLDRRADADPERTKETCIVDYAFTSFKTQLGTGEYVHKMLSEPPAHEAKKGKLTRLYSIDPATTEVIILYLGKDVSDDKDTPYDKAAYQAWIDHKFKIQFFMIHRLVANPLKHILQPTFEIVPKEEHEQIKKEKYIKSNSQFPIIRFHNDPVARCLGLLPMDIVKITRSSESAGEYVTYRICVR